MAGQLGPGGSPHGYSGVALRLAFLCLAPLVALLLGSWPLLLVTALISLAAAAFDVFQKRKKCIPFPIYLLVVLALQLSTFVIGPYTPFDTSPTNEPAMDTADISSDQQGLVPQTARMPIRTISVVIAAHNEHKYMIKTLDGIYETTPPVVLKEIIVIDDGSTPHLAETWKSKNYKNLRVIRHEIRRGLIKSKTEGGNQATGDMIMFLDGHVKPTTNWFEPLLRHMNLNYKRVVVPLIPILEPKSWEIDYNAVGVKMMFDWTLFFQWFEDNNDLVPCMSGGLFGITRQWWHESGEYDYGMNMWGAENIEQSIRIWLCGGEIYVARDSKIGHVFRSVFPYKVNNTEIYINKVRTVEAWFDEYKHNFYEADPAASQFKGLKGDISQRLALKEKLHCKPFKWYVEKFHNVFRDKGMLIEEMFLIKDTHTQLCLQVAQDSQHLHEYVCDSKNPQQRWSWAHSKQGIRNIGENKCLDANAGVRDKEGSPAFLYHCFTESKQQRNWHISNGYIKWNKFCVRGTKDGELLIQQCSKFLQRSGPFEMIPLPTLKPAEAAKNWQS